MKKIKTYYFFIVIATLFFAVELPAQDVVAPAIDTSTDETGSDEYYDKDTDDQTLSPYFSDTLTPNYRSIVYDSIDAINSDKGFYYKRYMDSLLRATQNKPQKPPSKRVDLRGTGFFRSIFGVIFWIAAIGLFAYIVYRLFLSNSSFLSRNRKNVESDIKLTTEATTNDPEAQLRNAIKNGNYRMAIRYLFLQTLSRLAERKFIEINTNKTNYEYVNEVRKHKFANEFASLTLKYEYVWYGEYPVDEKLFEQIQTGFVQFNKNFTRG